MISIGDRVKIIHSNHADVKAGQEGVVTDILEKDDGFGVEFDTLVYKTGATPKLEKERIIIFVRSKDLIPIE